jgi:ribosomal protein S18 acetylase RimI-like enzyme
MKRQYKNLSIQLLNSNHKVGDFNNDIAPLERWFRVSYSESHLRDGFETFVLVELENPTKILGYYALRISKIAYDNVPQELSIPYKSYPSRVFEVAYIAILQESRGNQLGQLLLNHAKELLSQQDERFLCIRAMNEKLALYYRELGFYPLHDPLKLLMRLA